MEQGVYVRLTMAAQHTKGGIWRLSHGADGRTVVHCFDKEPVPETARNRIVVTAVPRVVQPWRRPQHRWQQRHEAALGTLLQYSCAALDEVLESSTHLTLDHRLLRAGLLEYAYGTSSSAFV